MLYYERKLKKIGYNLIIGVDEVGRGPLAGPVVAAAVLLKTARFKNRIDDSKKLSSQTREKAFIEIIKKSVFGIGIVNEKLIDRFNIQVATRMAMEEAIQILVDKLTSHLCTVPGLKFDHRQYIRILVDGNVKLKTQLSYTNIIRGDSKSKSIAAASILAKVTRDHIMSSYDRLYPQYGFKEHKGYGTKMHMIALERFGPSLIHRTTFRPVRKNFPNATTHFSEGN